MDRSRAPEAPHPARFLPWFAVALAILVLKAPDALGHAQFWAEDAVVFFLQQRERGAGSLFLPSVGYLHLAPRLVALAAAWLPAALVPLAYNSAAALGGAFSLAWLCTRLREPAARVAFMAAVLLSLTNGEIFGTITNLQWFLQLFLLGACLAPAAALAAWRRWALAGLVLVAALTGPFSVFLAATCAVAAAAARLPGAAGLRAYLRSLDRVRVAALCVGACVQLGVYLAYRLPEPPAMTASGVVLGMGDVLQAHLFGSLLLPTPAFLVLLAGLLLLLLRQARHEALAADRWLLLALAVLGLVQAAAGMAKMTIPLEIAVSDRYLFVFKLAFWTGLALLLHGVSRSRSAALAASLAAMGLVAASNPDHLRRAPLEDKHWRDYAAALDRGEAVAIPVNPTPWTLHVQARPAPSP